MSALDHKKIAFLGGGNMATALIAGLRAQGVEASAIHVVDMAAETCECLQQAYDIGVGVHISDAFLSCDIWVLAVKPQQMERALKPLAAQLLQQTHQPLVVSIAAGVYLDDISRWLGNYTAVVRVMPNTPALIGAGMSGLYAHAELERSERAVTQDLMAAVGQCVWLDSEAQMDALTAVSGSGPAYLFYVLEALEAAGQAQGLAPEVARLLATQTMLGAARQAAASNDSATVLRERVTSKGGTTAAALAQLDQYQVADAFNSAIRAATQRSHEMGELFSRGNNEC